MKAEAANYTVTTLPDEDALVSDSLTLKLTNQTLSSYQWGSVAGVFETDSSTGNYLFHIPRPSGGENGGWSYSDVLTLNFEGVGELEGRKLNVTVTCDKIDVGTTAYYAGQTVPEYVNIAAVTGYKVWFGTSFFGSIAGAFRFNMQVDYTVTITWADTGKVVDMPFYQRASDLDTYHDPLAEAWTAGDGFDGQFYVYESCYLNINAPKFAVPVGGAQTGGNEQYTKSGVVGRTSTGQFSGTFEENYCATALEIFSEFTSLSDPVKSYSVTYK